MLAALVAARGGGASTRGDAAAGAGAAIVLVTIACLVLAIAFAVARIRSRRPSFWVPLACAAVWVLLTTAFVFAAVAADPAFAASLRTG